VYYVLSSLVVLLWVLLLSSLFTVVERKVLASAHRRKGPSYLGYFGLLQIVADGVKLLFKDWNQLGLFRSSGSITFWSNIRSCLACLWLFVFSYLCVSVLALDIIFKLEIPFLFLLIFAVGGLSHMGIVLTGVLTDSKWTILGAVRACIVYISYDVILLLCWLLLLPEGLCESLWTSGTISSLLDSQSSGVSIYTMRCPLIFLLLFLTVLIEVGRVPSDLSEAESELVSGYNVEYGGFMYALMASSEYASLVFGALLLVLLFFGPISTGYLSFLLVLVFTMFILVRGTLPRFRYVDILKLYWCDLMPAFLILFCVQILFT
jgi:NADH:ubiquinone oxidoreductase subunit H